MTDDNIMVSNRIFLSVDLSGSTAFKYQKIGDEEREVYQQKWQQVITDFYMHFVDKFKKNFKREANSASKKIQPEVWKTLGDEIVFTAELDAYSSASTLVLAFIKTLRDYRNTLSPYETLDLKASAWVADFPFRNIELSPKYWDAKRQSKRPGDKKPNERAPQAYQLDFIGPSMDLGFRLGKLSQIQKMPISVELAWMLSERCINLQDDLFTFGFGDLVDLKGVLGTGGRNYPFIYIDTSSEQRYQKLSESEKALNEHIYKMNQSSRVDRSNIRDFCKGFINHHHPELYQPYFPLCTKFGEIPAFYRKSMRRAKELDKRKEIKDKRDIEDANMESDTTQNEDNGSVLLDLEIRNISIGG